MTTSEDFHRAKDSEILEQCQHYPTPPAAGSGSVVKVLTIPNNPLFFSVVLGALEQLTFSDAWDMENPSNLTPEEAAEVASTMYLDFLLSEGAAEEMSLIGSVQAYAGVSAPAGWILCEGQAISRATYVLLFGVIGTVYGVGDGSTTFNLPDLRGRTIIGTGDGGAGFTDRALGDAIGAETHQLTEDELPRHNHGGTTHLATVSGAGGNHQPFAGSNRLLQNIPFVGLDEHHNNMQPSLALNYIICAGL